MSPKQRGSELFSDNQPEVALFEPTSGSFVLEVLEALRERKIVVVNLVHLTPLQRQRAADCLAGCACAIDGQTRWLGAHTWLCTPSGVEVKSDKSQ